MRFLIEPVYCMTWIWTLHSAHNKLKSPIKEDNIWANYLHAFIGYIFWKSDQLFYFAYLSHFSDNKTKSLRSKCTDYSALT